MTDGLLVRKVRKWPSRIIRRGQVRKSGNTIGIPDSDYLRLLDRRRKASRRASARVALELFLAALNGASAGCSRSPVKRRPISLFPNRPPCVLASRCERSYRGRNPAQRAGISRRARSASMRGSGGISGREGTDISHKSPCL